jgi:hypothetical protein
MRNVILVAVSAVASWGCQQHHPLTYAEAEQLCVIESSCFGGGFYNTCAGDALLYHDQDSLASCALSAGGRGDCDAVRACVGLTVQTDPSCTSSTTQTTSSCSGSTITECSNNPGEVPHIDRGDCAAFGEMCVTTTSGGVTSAQCVYGPCSWEGTSRCNGTSEARWCHSGYIDEVDTCGAGTTCHEYLVSGTMEAHCISDTPCTSSICDGDVLRQCDTVGGVTAPQHFYGASQDCALAGERCVLTPAGATCQANGTQCDPTMFMTACDNASIRYCGTDGEIHTYDCQAHGFAGCRIASDMHPYCVPTGADLFHT